MLGEEPLDLPPRTLRTRAVWWTLSAAGRPRAGRRGRPTCRGAAHAAEHASIGLLPLFATCDRWDIGGVSTALHPDTGLLTVFVYDGHPGGAGFAERGFDTAADWLSATRQAIAACECDAGCPSCIQSPKCGNGNDPLDKRGAVALLDALLADAGLATRGWPTRAEAGPRGLPARSGSRRWQRRRAPPGGRAARAHGSALGGEANSVLSDKDSCKVPPYATTSVGFATTSCESATGTRCSVTQTDYNITRSTAARVPGQIPTGR